MRLGGPSFWFDDIGGVPPRRPALEGEAEADVVLVGAGYTGLWTAWYLAAAAPGLRIAVVEKDFAGFGASGRNGGWLTGAFAWSQARYTQARGEAAVRAMVAALSATVDEVIRVAEAEGIGADILRTEELMVATNPAQLARLRTEVAHRRHWGEEARELGAEEVRARIAIPGALGAMAIPGVARIQPAKLVTGLARAVEARGIRIFEGSEVTAIRPGRVETREGAVRAPVVLRCTEGFTASLPGLRREWLPLNSAQIATAPLPPGIWAKIGWQGHEILGDMAHLYCYCQRSREGRLLVGARGVPYRFGSGLDRDGVPEARTVAHLQGVLRRLFPAAAGVPVTHGWCGTLGVPRDWCATVGFDPATGMGHAGGYVGVGVATSNLAGRALADLVLGRDTALTRLPMVNRPLQRWEPEPLRWLGVRGIYAALALADRAEARPGAGPSRLADLVWRLAGR